MFKRLNVDGNAQSQDFANLVLESRGIKIDEQMITIDKDCFGQLSDKRLPKNALANDLSLGGPVPPQLACLTFAEQRLIAMYRTAVHIVHLNARSPISRRADTRQLWMKGNTYCVGQNTPSVLDNLIPQLPPLASELPELLQVGKNFVSVLSPFIVALRYCS